MGDEQLANAIRASIEEVNNLMSKAADRGLDVSVQTIRHYNRKEGGAYDLLFVQVRKPL